MTNTRMNPVGVGLWVAMALVMVTLPVTAQDDSTSDVIPISRAEYEELLRRVGLLEGKVDEADENQDGSALAALRDRVDRVENGSDPGGTSKVLITGFGSVGYADFNGMNSSYSTQVNPIFVWKLEERVLFETELELGLTPGGSEAELGYANVSYLLGDRAAVSVGKFLTPFGNFVRNQHPSWINKLPDAPLHASHDGIVPMSSVGVMFSGATPIGSGASKVDYTVWSSNGPDVELTGDEYGHLNFNNNKDSNGNKSIGARVGVSATRELYVGASILRSRVDPRGSAAGTMGATLTALDFAYISQVPGWGGSLDVRGEWVSSNVSNPDTPYLDGSTPPVAIGPFDNSRVGGYLQAAFRPTGSDSDVWRNVEFVSRYSFLNGPHAGGVEDQDRYTVGVDYWTSPNSVAKLAWRFSDTERNGGLLLQLATGF